VLDRLKHVLTSSLGLPPVVVLTTAGLVAHILLNSLLRKSPLAAYGLIAPLCLGIGLESFEVWQQYRRVGLFAPGNDSLPLIIMRHFVDVLWLMVAPGLLVLGGSAFRQ
jgi:hypothetical protein